MRYTVVGLVSIVLVSCATGLGGIEREKILVEKSGAERKYKLFQPTTYEKQRKSPLLLVLHGGGVGSWAMIGGLAFERYAEEHGFIVAYPQGRGGHWNDGRWARAGDAKKAQVDDVAYLERVIEEIQAAYTIDPDRIYMTGISNGAMMTLRFACERPGLLAGIAPMLGNLPEAIADTCPSETPIAMLLITGTADPIVPFEGGPLKARNDARGTVLSSEETARRQAKANGCDMTPEIEEVPDRVKRDGTSVRRVTYAGCDPATPVVHDIIVGGGHVWPGGPRVITRPLLGRTSREFEAEERVVAFFAGLGQ